MTQILHEDDERSNNSETEPCISVTIVRGRVKSMFIGASGGGLATLAFASLNHGFVSRLTNTVFVYDHSNLIAIPYAIRVVTELWETWKSFSTTVH